MGKLWYYGPNQPLKKRIEGRVRNAFLLTIAVPRALTKLGDGWTPPRRFRPAYRHWTTDVIVYGVWPTHYLLKLWQWWLGVRWCLDKWLLWHGYMKQHVEGGYFRDMTIAWPLGKGGYKMKDRKGNVVWMVPKRMHEYAFRGDVVLGKQYVEDGQIKWEGMYDEQPQVRSHDSGDQG